MRVSRLPILLASSLSLFAVSNAGDNSAAFSRADLAAVARLRARALADSAPFRIVESLTTEVGPRSAGSPGDPAAVAWALRQMHQLGFANVHTVEATVPHWVRGEAELSITAPYPQHMPTLALGGSIGTGTDGIDADCVMVKDLDALKALPAGAVKNKIVYFNNRMERTQDGSGYGRAVPVRVAGPSAAAALGAVGVVIRSVSTSINRFPHTGALRYAADAPRIPALAISNFDADALERQFASGKPVRIHMKSTSRDLPPATSASVVGEIEGGERAQEIVILGAHLDSWDPGVGAIDDGAGVAIVLGAANLIRQAGLTPSRTIRVALFANEEFGTSGSQAYVATNPAETARHVLGLEADLGAGPVWRLTSRVNPAQTAVVDRIFRALAPFKIVHGANDAAGGADLDGLSKVGMPILSPDLDATNYFDVHHTANDTLLQVDDTSLRQSTAAYAICAWLGSQYTGKWERLADAKSPTQ